MTTPRKQSKKVAEISDDSVPVTPTATPSTETMEQIVIPDDPLTPTVTTPETVPSPQAGKDVLRRVLDVPKGKRAVPTLVSYRNVWTGEKRFLIIDVPEPVLRTAWSEWKAATGQTDPEVFIGDVCSVLDTDYPRLYRNVVPLDL